MPHVDVRAISFVILGTLQKLGFLNLQPFGPSDPFCLCHIHLWPVTTICLSLPNLYHNQSQKYLNHPTTYTCSSCILNHRSWISLNQNTIELLNQLATIFRHQYNHRKYASNIHHIMSKPKNQDNIYHTKTSVVDMNL